MNDDEGRSNDDDEAEEVDKEDDETEAVAERDVNGATYSKTVASSR